MEAVLQEVNPHPTFRASFGRYADLYADDMCASILPVLLQEAAVLGGEKRDLVRRSAFTQRLEAEEAIWCWRRLPQWSDADHRTRTLSQTRHDLIETIVRDIAAAVAENRDQPIADALLESCDFGCSERQKIAEGMRDLGAPDDRKIRSNAIATMLAKAHLRRVPGQKPWSDFMHRRLVIAAAMECDATLLPVFSSSRPQSI